MIEKRYKSYITRKNRITYGVFAAYIALVLIYAFYTKRYHTLFAVLPAIGFFLSYPNQYLISEDNILDVRDLFTSIFKPVSLNLVTRATQKSKNELILVYNRDGKRGDRVLRLSDADMNDFLNELMKRNPLIELSVFSK